MAYRFYIDSSVNCVFVQHFGTYEIGEEIAQLQATLKDPSYVRHMDLLRDATQVSLPSNYSLNWFRSAQKDVKSMTNVLGTKRKVAWVLGNADDFKLIHQWSTFERLDISVIERHPFRNVGNALKWLGLPGEYEISYPK